jgi:hypothetical protein
MKPRTAYAAVLAISILLPMSGAATAAHAESEETINAYASWAGRGQIYPTGPNSATFVGAFSGVIFVEKEKELLNGGNMMCPGLIEINLDDGKQQGKGRCTITNDEGERVFSEWSCAGTFAEGCTGDLKFTGGTGAFDGSGPLCQRCRQRRRKRERRHDRLEERPLRPSVDGTRRRIRNAFAQGD